MNEGSDPHLLKRALVGPVAGGTVAASLCWLALVLAGGFNLHDALDSSIAALLLGTISGANSTRVRKSSHGAFVGLVLFVGVAALPASVISLVPTSRGRDSTSEAVWLLAAVGAIGALSGGVAQFWREARRVIRENPGDYSSPFPRRWEASS